MAWASPMLPAARWELLADFWVERLLGCKQTQPILAYILIPKWLVDFCILRYWIHLNLRVGQCQSTWCRCKNYLKCQGFLCGLVKSADTWRVMDGDGENTVASNIAYHFPETVGMIQQYTLHKSNPSDWCSLHIHHEPAYIVIWCHMLSIPYTVYQYICTGMIYSTTCLKWHHFQKLPYVGIYVLKEE